MAMDDQTFAARHGVAATPINLAAIGRVRDARSRLHNLALRRWLSSDRSEYADNAFVAAGRRAGELEAIRIARLLPRA